MKWSERYRSHIIIISLICAACLTVEIFICNANAFRIKKNGEYEHKTYTLADMQITNADVDTGNNTITYRSDYGSYVFIQIDRIDTNIGTVYMDLEIPDGVLQYGVCYTDEANAAFYRRFDREYVSGVDKTKWFTCHLNGKSQQLIIRLEDLEDGYTFQLNELQINKPAPFRFSPIRFAVIFVTAVVLYGLRRTSFFLSRERTVVHHVILAGIFAVFLTIAILFYVNSYGDVQSYQMYNCDFTDALINGQLHLDIEVSEELQALENPYDTSVRQTQGVEYSWDTAYYNGKYYCYFGIVPALLFFVPYKLLTGMYLQCNIVVIIAYSLYMLFLDITVIRILRRLIPADVPFGMECIALILLNSAINIFCFAAEPTFYHVLYAVGLCFVSAGFGLLTFWYTGKRKHKLLLFIGALLLALAVGCRPPLLLYTLFLVPFGIQIIKEKKKACVADIVVLLIPYLVVGSGLAVYNYLRFDNFMEFGVTYQLTAQDQVHGSHTLYEIPLLLWLGFFQPLHFSAVFPFITPGDPANNYAGSFFREVGLTPLLSQMPVLIILFIPAAWKKWKQETSVFSYIALLFIAAAGFLLMIMEFLNSGVAWRYTSEIAPVLCTAAVLLLANWIRRLESKTASGIMTVLFLSALYSFAVAFFRGMQGVFGYMLTYHPEFYYSIERAFCFWK